MHSYAALVPLALGLFVTTNLDDLFVLLGFFSDPRFRLPQVALGQFIGIATLYGVSVAASLLSLVVSPAYVGLLGILPIAIGLKKMWELREGEGDGEEAAATDKGARWRPLTVAAVTIADGGDNLGVYIPLFATRPGVDVAVIGVVFAVMTLLWVGAAFWLTTHRTLGAPIRRYGRRVVPFVLVALGAYIVWAAGSVALLVKWL